MAIMPHPPLIGLLVEEGVGLGPEAADLEGLNPEHGHEQDPADSDDDDSDEEYEPEGQQRGRLFQLLGRYLYPLFTLGLSPRSRKQNRHMSDWTRAILDTVYLSGPKVYSCSNCRTHLSTDDDVISRAFQGRGGRAFLVERVINVSTGPMEDRLLMTGLHKVKDIYCKQCKENLGWKYEEALEHSQKYKEGRFILEKVRLVREGW